MPAKKRKIKESKQEGDDLVLISISELEMLEHKAFEAIPNVDALSDTHNKFYISSETGIVYWETQWDFFKFDPYMEEWEPWE